MLKLVTGAVSGLWNKLPGVAKWGVGGAAVYAGGSAVSNAGGIFGLAEKGVGAAGELGAHGTVEQTKNTFSKMLAWLADILGTVFGDDNQASRFLRRLGEGSLGREHAEQAEAARMAELPLNSPERQAQRIYETAVTSGPDARYRIDGPGGSPPSVEMSDQPPSLGNTVNLGFKGIKDGVGVAVGWAGGLVAGAADLVGLDGSFGLNSDWAGKTSRGLSGAVNEATDVVAYDVVGKGLGGAFGLVTGQGLSGFTQDYEPTIRSEADQTVYGVTSTVSGVAVGAFTGSFLTGAFSLSSAGAATLAEAAAAPMTTASLGAGILRGGFAASAGRVTNIAAGIMPTGRRGPTPTP